VGASRLGKTEFARSIGRHIYMEGIWNLAVWDKEAEYLLLDDVPFKKLGAQRKGIWGAQKEIGVTGKWQRDRNIKWGKPMIFCCNADNFYRDLMNERGGSYLSPSELDWYDANSLVVHIDRKMYLTETDEL